MSSQSSPVVPRYKGKRAPSAGTVVAVLVTLLIGFLWLHFFLALKIESAGREIQVKTAELQRIEHHNHELRYQISIHGSQEHMNERNRELGYGPQQPLYLLADEPLPPSTQGSRPGSLELLGIAEGSTQAPVPRSASGPVTGNSIGE